jgi:hypothetical protein
MKRANFAVMAALVLALAGGRAEAAGGNSAQGTGQAKAFVVMPVSFAATGDLSFGQFVRPTSAGTLTVSAAGAVSTTGGVTGNTGIAQGASGPAAGTFQIVTAPNSPITVYGPTTFTISNGAQTMTVSNLTGSLQQLSANANSRTFRLSVGARLAVSANQAVGTYTGSYTLLAIYQ